MSAPKDPEESVSEEFEEKDAKRQKVATDAKIARFTNALVGTRENKGPLRERRLTVCGILGRKNIPYEHQRRCAKWVLIEQRTRAIFAHDPGTGKTFTCFLFVAAKQVYNHNKVQKVLISAPASCLEQWANEAINTLSTSAKRVLKVVRLSQVTEESIASHDVIIVSRNLIGNAYSSCHQWVPQHSQNERGHWISKWDRKPGTELHPIFRVKFSVFGIDELVRGIHTSPTHTRNGSCCHLLIELLLLFFCGNAPTPRKWEVCSSDLLANLVNDQVGLLPVVLGRLATDVGMRPAAFHVLNARGVVRLFGNGVLDMPALSVVVHGHSGRHVRRHVVQEVLRAFEGRMRQE